MGATRLAPSSSELQLSVTAAERILDVTHFAYPILLLVEFLIVFTIHSVLTASDDTPVLPSSRPRGPGGKPLPKNPRRASNDARQKAAVDFSRSQKLTLDWLVIGLITTLVGNATNIIIHALTKRPWWCGEAAVVSSPPPIQNPLGTDQATKT